MSVAPSPPPRQTGVEVPPLVEGQRLDQPTFHARYEAMPPATRAELIGGVVSMPSPAGYEHGGSMVPAVVWLDRYAEHTPGVEVLDNVTVILDWRNEPQPDLTLRVLPDYGGRTRNEGGYVAGVPELVVEVARSSRYMDLGPKFDEYERAGVLEYVVRALDPDEILWHVLENGRFIAVKPDPDGLYRSRAFPGLWLDPTALLAGDRGAVRAALDRGVATPEHAAFVARLAAARGNPPA
jgi:hypothetical protein